MLYSSNLIIMDRESFIEALKDKVAVWQDELSILLDDAERGDEEVKEDNLERVHSLFRSFEEIESRLEEMDQMSEEEFETESELIEQEVEDLEADLIEVREDIQDV